MEAFLASGDLLDDLGINPRILGVQVAVFIATFVLLSRLLFGRVLGQMRRREEEIRAAREALERDRAEAARLAREYEAYVAQADKEGYERMQAILREAISQAAQSVSRAQAQAREEVARAREAIAGEKREALQRLSRDIRRLTVAVAERALDARLDPAAVGGEERT